MPTRCCLQAPISLKNIHSNRLHCSIRTLLLIPIKPVSLTARCASSCRFVVSFRGVGEGGALTIGRTLLLPYAVADSFTAFASRLLDELLKDMS